MDRGIYRGREAPENAAFDLVNVLLDDEGQPFRRGGSAYQTTSDAGGTLTGLADSFTLAGARTISWRSGTFTLREIQAVYRRSGKR